MKISLRKAEAKNEALIARCKADRFVLFSFLGEVFQKTPQEFANKKLSMAELKTQLAERDSSLSQGSMNVSSELSGDASKEAKIRTKMLQLAENVSKSRSETQKVVAKLQEVVTRCKQLQKQNELLKEDRVKMKRMLKERSISVVSRAELDDLNSTNVDATVLQKLQEKCDRQVADNEDLVLKLRTVVGKFKEHKEQYTKSQDRENKLVQEVEQLKRNLEETTSNSDRVVEQYNALREKAKSVQEIARSEKAKRESLESELASMKSTHASASTELSDLRDRLRDSEATVSKMSSVVEERDASMKEIEILKKSLSESTSKSDRVVEQYNALREKAKSVQEIARSERAKRESLESEFASSKTVECVLSRKLNATRSELSEMKAADMAERESNARRLEVYSERQIVLGNECETYERKIEESRRIEQVYADELETERRKSSTIIGELKMAQGKLQEGWSQYERLKGVLKRTKEENASSAALISENGRTKIDEIEHLAQERLERATEASALVDRLKERLRSQMNEGDELRTRLEDLQDEMAEAVKNRSEEKRKFESSFSDQDAENKRLVRLLGQNKTASKAQLRSLEKEKRALESEMRLLTKKLEEEQSRVEDANKIRKRLEVLEEEKKEHIADLTKTDLDIIRDVKAEKAAMIESLREMANKERQRVEQFKQKLRDVMSMCTKYKDQNALLKQNLADAERRVDIGKTQIVQLSRLISSMHK